MKKKCFLFKSTVCYLKVGDVFKFSFYDDDVFICLDFIDLQKTYHLYYSRYRVRCRSLVDNRFYVFDLRASETIFVVA